MKYALLLYGNEQAWAALDEAERKEAYAAHERFSQMLIERGAMRGGGELGPTSDATTVRNTGQVGVTDGPFAETAEVFGGYYVIEVDDLDAAIEIAKQVPEPTVEIRPLL